MTACQSIRQLLLSAFASSVLLFAPAAAGQSSSANPNSTQAEATAPESKPAKQHDPWTERMGVSIGLVSVVLGIGIAVLAIWTEYKKRLELIQSVHRERMAALDKGMEPPPLPPELFSWDKPKRPHVPGDYLKPGVIWLMVGLGLGLFLFLQKPAGTKYTAGLIPIFVGTGYLICHWLECRRDKRP